MRFSMNPFSILRGATVCASVLTMCMAPVAQGAAAKKTQKQLISQYLKETGLSRKDKNRITAGEFYNTVRVVYPEVLRKELDGWFADNGAQSLPIIQASSYVDADNVEQVRLTLSKEGETMTLTFTGHDEFPLKVNGVTLSRAEILNPDNFEKMAQKVIAQDKAIAKSMKKGSSLVPFLAGTKKAKPSKATKAETQASPALMVASLKAAPTKKLLLPSKSYSKLTHEQRIEYFMRIRSLVDAADRVQKNLSKKTAALDFETKNEYALKLIFGAQAQANIVAGGRCVIAGYMSTYGRDLSCGTDNTTDTFNQYGAIMGRAANVPNCSGTAVPCNPLVYGFTDSGTPHCIAGGRANLRTATSQCNSKSPLSGPGISAEQEALNKKRISESFLKIAGGKEIKINPVNKDGEYKIPSREYQQISEYISGLGGFINDSKALCESDEGRSTTTLRPDQMEACVELAKRAFDLKTFSEQAIQPPTNGGGGDNGGLPPNCDVQITNSVLVLSKDGKGVCECPVGTQLSEDGKSCVEDGNGGGGIVVDEPEKVCKNNKPPVNGKCEKNRSWLIPLGLGIVALGALWWITSNKKDKKNPPTYVPPVAPPGTPEVPVVGPPTTPTPPVIAPCPAPNVFINGSCTPVVVYSGEGGTAIDEVGRGGGVRDATGAR